MERERDSAMIGKKAKILIRYDQQANLQCNATLAKEHTKSATIPRGLPHWSRTGVGEDRWPTRSSLTLPTCKWYFSHFKFLRQGIMENNNQEKYLFRIPWLLSTVWTASYNTFELDSVYSTKTRRSFRAVFPTSRNWRQENRISH